MVDTGLGQRPDLQAPADGSSLLAWLLCRAPRTLLAGHTELIHVPFIWVFAEPLRVSLEGASFPVQHSSPALLPLGHYIQVDAANCGP